MYKHILLPTDGSELSLRAVTAGIQLAKKLDARVTSLYVSEATYIPSIDEQSSPHAEAALASVAQLAKEAGITAVCTATAGDTPQDAIVRTANEEGCDLIIMGTHGRSLVGKFILGSIAASLLAECDIPVLLYR